MDVSETRFDRCPACGELIYANVRCVIGPPVNLVIPCYLSHVVLDQHGQVVAWRPSHDTLAESLDFHADGYAPDQIDIYCDNGHAPLELVLALQAGKRFRRGESTSQTDDEQREESGVRGIQVGAF